MYYLFPHQNNNFQRLNNVVRIIKNESNESKGKINPLDLKNLKFRDFLTLNENIKYVDPEEAFKLISSN